MFCKKTDVYSRYFAKENVGCHLSSCHVTPRHPVAPRLLLFCLHVHSTHEDRCCMHKIPTNNARTHVRARTHTHTHARACAPSACKITIAVQFDCCSRKGRRRWLRLKKIVFLSFFSWNFSSYFAKKNRCVFTLFRQRKCRVPLVIVPCHTSPSTGSQTGIISTTSSVKIGEGLSRVFFFFFFFFVFLFLY